jgi:hypothetical protein
MLAKSKAKSPPVSVGFSPGSALSPVLTGFLACIGLAAGECIDAVMGMSLQSLPNG